MGTVHFGGEWGDLSIASRRPHPGLRRVITGYRGFGLRTAAPLERIGTPMALPSLFIGFVSDPVTARNSSEGPESEKALLHAAVQGLGTRAVHLLQPAVYYSVQVQFTLDGASQLLGPRLSEFTDVLPEASDVFGPQIALIQEQLAEAPGWAARFDLLDRVFLGLAEERYEVPKTVHWVFERLHEEGAEAVRIDKLAKEVGWSQRRLELAFRRHVGMTPKSVVRMARFRRAMHLLLSSTMSQSEIAALCGYYDQAHLIRDFKAVTGTTPRRFTTANATLYHDLTSETGP